MLFDFIQQLVKSQETLYNKIAGVHFSQTVAL